MRVDEKLASEPWQWLGRALCIDIRCTARGFRRGNPILKGDHHVLIIENQEHFVSTDFRNWTLFDIENWTPGLSDVAPRLGRGSLSR